MFYFARCMNTIFNSLLAQLVEYDVHTTRKMKFIHAIFYHILLLSYKTFCPSALSDRVCSLRSAVI